MGIYLSSPKTETASEDGGNHRLRYGLASMQGWRTSMEDAHAAIPNLDSSTSFFGVYDGHGGKCVSKFCAKYLHQEFLKHEAYQVGDLCTAIRKTFLRMDVMMCGQTAKMELREMEDKGKKGIGVVEELLGSPRKGSPRKGELAIQVNGGFPEEGSHCDSEGLTAGTTACVAIIRENKLVVANAGDSRCVISRRGQAHDLSKDHKPDLEEEKQRILKAGGFIQTGRINASLNLSRAIGDMEFKQRKDLPPEKQMVTANPDVKTHELSGDDEFLVLACDGIWDCMSSQEVVDFIHDHLKSEQKLSVICQRVLENCLAPSAGAEGCDNMTMILLQLNNKT